MAKDNRVKIFTFVCICDNREEIREEDILYPHIICSSCGCEMRPLTTAKYEIQSDLIE